MVVVDVDGDFTEIPLLGARVHHERRRDASRKRSWKELVRCGGGALPAETFGLIGGQPVAAVDQNFLAERPWYRMGRRSEAHESSFSRPQDHPSDDARHPGRP